MAHALFAGTFDPPTLGHLDVIRRATQLFARLTVAIAEHPSKQHLLDVETRLRLLRECTRDLANVDVRATHGLTVDAARELGCDVLVRGVRCGTDFDYEAQMAGTNRAMSGLDTALLATAPEHAHLTGTLVRQIVGMGGDVSRLVPAPVARALAERRAR
jgi:pantetheine-phosphate adenylyltransferase